VPSVGDHTGLPSDIATANLHSQIDILLEVLPITISQEEILLMLNIVSGLEFRQKSLYSDGSP
jgi:hypothetical protein